MSAHPTSPDPTVTEHPMGGVRYGAWTRVNAIGLALAYGLFAVVGDGVEMLFDLDHDGVARNIPTLFAIVIGAGIFSRMRQRALAPLAGLSRGVAMGSGLGFAGGFLLGFAIAGPPLDFMLATLTFGVIGALAMRRHLASRLVQPNRFRARVIGAWLAAAVAAPIAALAAVGPMYAVLGEPAEGSVAAYVSFIAALAFLGLVGGATGGALEWRALRRHLEPSVP
jgi:hypothetical protein